MGFEVDDVITQATTEELSKLVCGDGNWHTSGVERLGVPRVHMADGPHGLRVEETAALGESRPATCFPPAVGLASSWNPALLKRVGAALGREAVAQGVDVVLGPGINIKRSPLCGRNFEYFSEDPLVAGRLASAMVYGLQSQGVGACVKHFAANNQETDRMRVDARVSERALREIYLPAFETVIGSAHPWMVMCAYNRLNGTLVSENPWLLTDVLRGDWDYDGAVVSDWGAVVDRVESLVAGLDLEMPHEQGNSDVEVAAAVESGQLSREILELAAARILALTERAMDAVRDNTPVDEAEHHQLAREAARESMVLLANDGVLPLAPRASVALVGEFARTPRFQGGGSSRVNATRVERLVDTLASRRRVTFAPGFLLSGESDDALVDEAVAAAEASDVVVLCLGLPDAEETEGVDRTQLRLPDVQLALLAELAETGKPIVVVLSNGAAVEVAPWADQCAALLEGWLGGQAGALALADVLVGDAEPSGRLTETLALRLADHPSSLMFPGESGHVDYGEGVFVGYRGFDAADREVAFPFGFGLGYTTFSYDKLVAKVTGTPASGDLRIVVQVTVTNTGERAGSEVVQVYVGNAPASVPRPPRELRAFAKVRLEPGESRTVTLPLDSRAFAFWSEVHDRWVVESGLFTIEAGPNVRDLPLVQELRLDMPARRVRLHAESTLAEWMADDQAWAALMARVPGGQGFSLPEEVIAVVGGAPLRRFAKFPGIPLTAADVDAVLASHG
ncbi:glycoside hydrolase family 3 C-terminal domain-containing protein [Propioniciclava sinopodophylli]|uniref:glycoside hydrolase family 3 C-terminal domain-containing protein n=1 Tax=Propioniciclava sinopodophylli TaxID=1837344 RepID=UPI0024920E79|nr:glycoside hydrolase family 3 C-terminal domain-containing protein [Propioniciclava sinopodophylli]